MMDVYQLQEICIAHFHRSAIRAVFHVLLSCIIPSLVKVVRLTTARDEDEGSSLCPPLGRYDRIRYWSGLEKTHFCDFKAELDRCSGVLQEELC